MFVLDTAETSAEARLRDHGVSQGRRRPRCPTVTAARSASTQPNARPDATRASAVCPTAAITRVAGQPVALDLGRCIFCAACVEALSRRAPSPTRTTTGWPSRRRDDLVLGEPGHEEVRLAPRSTRNCAKLFGRSLRLRQVSAGGCNGCEADVNVLGTIGWDLGRFGIQFVASPRHADGLLITGPVTRTWNWRSEKPTTPCPNRRSSSPSAPAPSPAAHSSVTPRSTTALLQWSRSTSSSPAARPIR